MKSRIDPRHLSRIIAVQKLFNSQFKNTKIFPTEDILTLNNNKQYNQVLLDKISNVQIRGNLTINSSEVLNIEVVFFAMPDTNNYIYSGGLNNISGLNKLVGVTS